MTAIPPFMHTLPDLTDPHDPAVAASLARSCDLCGAARDQLCHNSINPTMPVPGGRVVHIARLVDRRRESKGE